MLFEHVFNVCSILLHNGVKTRTQFAVWLSFSHALTAGLKLESFSEPTVEIW